MFKKLCVLVCLCIFTSLMSIKNTYAELTETEMDAIMKEAADMLDYSKFEQEPESKKAAICIGTAYASMECIKKGSVEGARLFVMYAACYKKEYSQIPEEDLIKYINIGKYMTMIVTKGCNDLSYTSQLLGNYCRPNMVRLNSCMEQMVKGY